MKVAQVTNRWDGFFFYFSIIYLRQREYTVKCHVKSLLNNAQRERLESMFNFQQQMACKRLSKRLNKKGNLSKKEVINAKRKGKREKGWQNGTPAIMLSPSRLFPLAIMVLKWNGFENR